MARSSSRLNSGVDRVGGVRERPSPGVVLVGLQGGSKPGAQRHEHSQRRKRRGVSSTSAPRTSARSGPAADHSLRIDRPAAALARPSLSIPRHSPGRKMSRNTALFFSRPSSSHIVNATSGSRTPAASTTTRTTMNGIPASVCDRGHRRALHVHRCRRRYAGAAARFSSGDVIGCVAWSSGEVEVSTRPLNPRQPAGRATPDRPPELEPSVWTTTSGRTTVPGSRSGSRPPATPQLTSARRAALQQSAAPLPRPLRPRPRSPRPGVRKRRSTDAPSRAQRRSRAPPSPGVHVVAVARQRPQREEHRVAVVAGDRRPAGSPAR